MTAGEGLADIPVVRHAYDWFDAFTRGFVFTGAQAAHMAAIKDRHSRSVAALCRDLGDDLGWSARRRATAEILGLLHDVGRFPQVARYTTFVDITSMDHGEAGARILAEADVLDGLTADLRAAVLDGVRHHNKRDVPAALNGISRSFVMLIRDADKLDIFSIIVEAIREGTLTETIDAGLALPPEGSPHPDAVADIRAKRTVAHSHIATRTDFLLMQLSWVYDFTYLPALDRLHASGHLDAVRAQLPPDPLVHDLADAVFGDFAALRTRE